MIECVAYDLVRKNLEQLWRSGGDTIISSLVIKTVQMSSTKDLEKLFYLPWTWCFSIHRERMKNLGKWNFE